MNNTIKQLINKLKECDDFHNRCDCLLEHDEITYLLEYINQLETSRYKAIEYIKKHLYLESTYGIQHSTSNGKMDQETSGFDMLEILKGEE